MAGSISAVPAPSATPISLVAEKKQVRTALRALRDAIDAATARAEAAAAAARVVATLPRRSDLTVAVYASMGSELGTETLCAQLVDRGARVVFPRVPPEGLVLSFHAAAHADLVPSPRGIPEPVPSNHPAVALADIHAFVVPGLAFDRAGARLGWGRGYYDVTLAQRPGALRLGYAFDLQVVDHVPSNFLDERMDRLVTPSSVHLCPARASAPSGRSEP